METESSQPLPQKFENLKIKDEEPPKTYYDRYMAEYTAQRRLKYEKSKQIIKDFLQQVDDNRFSEFSWPPDPDYYAYEYIRFYVEDFQFKEDSEAARKYIDQIHETWGYGVDSTPPPWMGRFLHWISPGLEFEAWFELIGKATQCVIENINAEAKKIGKTFKLVSIDNAVRAGHAIYLLSLTVEVANAKKNIRAMVSMPPPCVDPIVVECKLVSCTVTS